jgi:hypothetical protein
MRPWEEAVCSAKAEALGPWKRRKQTGPAAGRAPEIVWEKRERKAARRGRLWSRMERARRRNFSLLWRAMRARRSTGAGEQMVV